MKMWGDFQTETGTCYFRQVGPLKVWIEHHSDEWLIASSMAPDEYTVVQSETLTQPPEDQSWNRYVLTGNSKSVSLFPATPDRPVVVRPESKVTIESGAKALFYVLLPIWIKIAVGTNGKHPLTELPTKVLSNTWFGEPHEGELCYYLKTWARRSLDGLNPRPHQVVCPVHIKNTSGNKLEFNRLCIRTDFLTIYEGATWLWTNKVNVQFRGVNQTSKIKYDAVPPDFEPTCTLIGSPRQKPTKEFSIKSFDNFKAHWLG